VAEFALDAEFGHQAGIIFSTEQFLAIFPRLFGPLHGAFGFVQERFGAGGIRAVQRDAQTGGDNNFFWPHVAGRGDQLAHAVSEDHGRPIVGDAVQENGEFIIAQSRHGIAHPGERTQSRRHRFQ
jgi:hypothetical protein